MWDAFIAEMTKNDGSGGLFAITYFNMSLAFLILLLWRFNKKVDRFMGEVNPVVLFSFSFLYLFGTLGLGLLVGIGLFCVFGDDDDDYDDSEEDDDSDDERSIKSPANCKDLASKDSEIEKRFSNTKVLNV